MWVNDADKIQKCVSRRVNPPRKAKTCWKDFRATKKHRKNRRKKIQMMTRQGSTRTRESLRNAAVYHGVKVNEFQAGLKNHSRLQKGFLLHSNLVCSRAKKRMEVRNKVLYAQFFKMPAGRCWFLCAHPPTSFTWCNLRMVLVRAGSLGSFEHTIAETVWWWVQNVQCYSLTGCLQLFRVHCYHVCLNWSALFFWGGGGGEISKKKHTHNSTFTKHLSPEDALEDARYLVPRCQLMPSEPRISEFPFDAKAESSSFKKNETITVTRQPLVQLLVVLASKMF